MDLRINSLSLSLKQSFSKNLFAWFSREHPSSRHVVSWTALELYQREGLWQMYPLNLTLSH